MALPDTSRSAPIIADTIPLGWGSVEEPRVTGNGEARGRGKREGRRRCEGKGRCECRRKLPPCTHVLLRISQVIGVAPDIRSASRPSNSPFQSPLHRRVAPPYRLAPSSRCLTRVPHPPTSPPMAATASGSWTCGECGKVCKSRGGLTKHSSTHKQGSRVGGDRDNLHRIYHATLDGTLSPLFHPSCRF